MSAYQLSLPRKLLLSFMILLALFIVIELGLRSFFAFWVGPSVFMYGTTPNNHTVMHHGNELGNYSKYYPNQVRVDHDQQTGEVFQVTINSNGFRGKEFADLNSDGRIRVVTLGASSTFGYFDRDNETYPYYMEQLLNQQCSGQAFEVLNLGIPHSSSDQILSLFIAEALPLNPDVITYYEGMADAGKSEPQTVGQEAREWLRQLSFISRFLRTARDHVLTLDLLDSLLAGQVKRFSKDDLDNHVRGKSKHFLSSLSQIYKESNKRGIVFILGNQQAKSHLIKTEDIKGVTYQEELELVKRKLDDQGLINDRELTFLSHSKLMADLKSWGSANDIPFVDIIEATNRDRDILLSFVHLSPRGNRLVAQAFVNEILTHECSEN